MHTITQEIDVYSFNELSDNAKINASQWLNSDGYAWQDENIKSVEAFCEEFGVKVTNYSISLCNYSFIETDAQQVNFRNLKLKNVNREYMPTGYCLDCTLFHTFYDDFKRTGNAKLAFDNAIDAALKDILSDFEYQGSDDYIAESCEANGYEFDVNGLII